MITKEQHERLKEYESYLHSSYYANYCRNMGTQRVLALDAIYKEIFGHDSRLTSGCSYCVLEDMKKLGKVFYEYKEEEEPQPQPVEENKEKPKRGRPAKNK